MIENNTGRIASTETTIKDTLEQALVASAEAAKDNKEAGAAVSDRVDAADTKIDTVKAQVDAADAAIVKIQSTLKEQKEEQEAAAAQEVEVAASWQFIANQ